MCPRTVEFAAHAGNVNCVRVGRKSWGVLVTGGEDKKVNVWAIGTVTATMVRGRPRWLAFGTRRRAAAAPAYVYVHVMWMVCTAPLTNLAVPVMLVGAACARAPAPPRCCLAHRALAATPRR